MVAFFERLKKKELSIQSIFAAGFIIRVIVMAYGEWQDANSTHYSLPNPFPFFSVRVKYTDVDYEVYTDASRMLSIGRSPFDRTTFRYTPLL
jgi:phosphatidylinositol glycan class M